MLPSIFKNTKYVRITQNHFKLINPILSAKIVKILRWKGVLLFKVLWYLQIEKIGVFVPGEDPGRGAPGELPHFYDQLVFF